MHFLRRFFPTIDDAVLGYYKGLYPTTLNNLNWVENSNLYVLKKITN